MMYSRNFATNRSVLSACVRLRWTSSSSPWSSTLKSFVAVLWGNGLASWSAPLEQTSTALESQSSVPCPVSGSVMSSLRTVGDDAVSSALLVLGLFFDADSSSVAATSFPTDVCIFIRSFILILWFKSGCKDPHTPAIYTKHGQKRFLMKLDIRSVERGICRTMPAAFYAR